MVNYRGIFQASRCTLYRYFVGRVLVNYFGISSGVSCFISVFRRACRGQLSRYFVGRILVNYFDILSGASWLILSGVLRWMISVFCRVCNEQLTYKGLQFTINCVRSVKDKMTMEQVFLQVFQFSLANKYSTRSCICHSRVDQWTYEASHSQRRVLNPWWWWSFMHISLEGWPVDLWDVTFAKTCSEPMMMMMMMIIHASITRGLTSGLMRRHIRRDVFWTHDDDDDDSSSSNSRQQLGSLPVVTCSCT